jgi:probable F420-dependent oxidoreductase
MKFGLAFANIGPYVDPEAAHALARRAERAGFESLWTVDHVVVPAGYRSRYPYDPSGRLPSGEATPFPDPLIWMAHVAAATSTLRLATGILVVPQRNPLELAKQLATLDHLSGGRVILGAGIGWLEEEFEALGVPFAGRGERTDEAVAAMRALWSEDEATFNGKTVGFERCVLRPRPRQGTIPVHIGGHSPAAARRAGRIGDGFFPFGVGVEELTGLMATVRQTAEDAGRDPSSIELTVQRGVTAGPEAQSELAELAERGVTRIVLPAVLFGEAPLASLEEYGETVIGTR